jgi:hypothetical protein
MFHVVTVSVDYHSRKARTRGDDSPANVARTENHIAGTGCGERAAVQARSIGCACTGGTIQGIDRVNPAVFEDAEIRELSCLIEGDGNRVGGCRLDILGIVNRLAKSIPDGRERQSIGVSRAIGNVSRYG